MSPLGRPPLSHPTAAGSPPHRSCSGGLGCEAAAGRWRHLHHGGYDAEALHASRARGGETDWPKDGLLGSEGLFFIIYFDF